MTMIAAFRQKRAASVNCGRQCCQHACRCDENCGTHVDRRRALRLTATCRTSAAEAELPCTGRVQWELHELGDASSDHPDALPAPVDWTGVAGGGSTLAATGADFPDTDDFVTFAVKASG